MENKIKISAIIDLPKMKNDCDRAIFLLNNIDKDISKLKDIGIDVTVNTNLNDGFRESLVAV